MRKQNWLTHKLTQDCTSCKWRMHKRTDGCFHVHACASGVFWWRLNTTRYAEWSCQSCDSFNNWATALSIQWWPFCGCHAAFNSYASCIMFVLQIAVDFKRRGVCQLHDNSVHSVTALSIDASWHWWLMFDRAVNCVTGLSPVWQHCQFSNGVSILWQRCLFMCDGAVNYVTTLSVPYWGSILWQLCWLMFHGTVGWCVTGLSTERQACQQCDNTVNSVTALSIDVSPHCWMMCDRDVDWGTGLSTVWRHCQSVMGLSILWWHCPLMCDRAVNYMTNLQFLNGSVNSEKALSIVAWECCQLWCDRHVCWVARLKIQ
jgi:hypothetical protein